MQGPLSSDEFAMLKAFAKQSLIEDKRLHGITDNPNKDKKENKTKKLTTNFYAQDKSKTVATNNTYNNKLNQFSLKNEANKPPPYKYNPIKPPNPNTTKPAQKPIQKPENKNPPTQNKNPPIQNKPTQNPINQKPSNTKPNIKPGGGNAQPVYKPLQKPEQKIISTQTPIIKHEDKKKILIYKIIKKKKN